MSNSLPNWHFDYLAPVYDYLSFDRNYDLILDELNLKEGEVLLDLAGGTGEFLEELINRNVLRREDAHVIDLSESMLEQAEKRGLPNIHHGDCMDMPFPDNRFDGVFTGDAVHHMGKPVLVFEEVRRVLKPGGRFVIEEFDPGRPIGKLLYAVERLSGMGSQFRKPRALQSLIEEAGFDETILRQEGFVYYLTAVA